MDSARRASREAVRLYFPFFDGARLWREQEPVTLQHRSDRDAALRGWLDAALASRGERAVAAPAMIVGDASFRRFWRVATPTQQLVAMDSPPATENNAQFVRLSSLFRRSGVHVPEVLAYDLDRGFLLVSDLGDRLYGDVYGSNEAEPAFEAALRTIVRLQRIDNPTALIPPYTTARFIDELGIFTTWFVRGLVSAHPDEPIFATVTRHLIDNVLEQPRACVHRDFHSRNLIWSGSEARVVDFQDALWGPISYDLASLLRDCYVRLPEPEIACRRTRWLELATADGRHFDAERLARWLDLMAVQRQLKAIGIFARLMLRDGRATHLRHIVPVLDHVSSVCAGYRELLPFGEWIVSLRPRTVARLATLGMLS
jgi:aminoglycoside/choline kinase family phosphotransferase